MLHQNVTNGFPTLEGLALAKVRERFPSIQRKGFSRAVRIACNGECLPRPPVHRVLRHGRSRLRQTSHQGDDPESAVHLHLSWRCLGQRWNKSMDQIAAISIRAMRVPNQQMLNAVGATATEFWLKTWEKMINAALDEEEDDEADSG